MIVADRKFIEVDANHNLARFPTEYLEGMSGLFPTVSKRVFGNRAGRPDQILALQRKLGRAVGGGPRAVLPQSNGVQHGQRRKIIGDTIA